MPHSFPRATQAQLIRANQRDLMGIAQLRDMADSVLRATLGTRWMLRWEKEVDLISRLAYLSLTTGAALQTLGEEYVDIWQRTSRTRRPPSTALRWTLIALYTLPQYAASRLSQQHATWKKALGALDILSEVNLALFYFSGTYYALAKRLLGIRHISSMPEDSRSRPPSYALLGVLLSVRLIYRLLAFLRSFRREQDKLSGRAAEKQREHDADILLIDGRRATSILDAQPDEAAEHDAEKDPYTVLNLRGVSDAQRSGRRCVLCLEERTASCATECGHLFCWTCIVGWGREKRKPECPLCRQSLDLARLQPIANL